MKINPVGGGGLVPPNANGAAAGKDIKDKPAADTVELGTSSTKTKDSPAPTYSRADVVASSGTGTNQLVETQMTSDARASRLAAIEKRVGEGAYNTREIIERVADRLLQEWGLSAQVPHAQSE